MHHIDGLWNGILSDLLIESIRYGHCPCPGIIGATLSETTLAIWALSHNTMAQMSNDVAELDNEQDHVVIVIRKNGQFAITTIHGKAEHPRSNCVMY